MVSQTRSKIWNHFETNAIDELKLNKYFRFSEPESAKNVLTYRNQLSAEKYLSVTPYYLIYHGNRHIMLIRGKVIYNKFVGTMTMVLIIALSFN